MRFRSTLTSAVKATKEMWKYRRMWDWKDWAITVTFVIGCGATLYFLTSGFVMAMNHFFP